ncbi:hypothetical protein E2320_022521, partial [Naja naja]
QWMGKQTTLGGGIFSQASHMEGPMEAKAGPERQPCLVMPAPRQPFG